MRLVSLLPAVDLWDFQVPSIVLWLCLVAGFYMLTREAPHSSSPPASGKTPARIPVPAPVRAG